MKRIDPKDLNLSVVNTLLNRWMLLSAGDFSQQQYNCMTVAWGFIGAMWNKPCAIAAVRPTRYTYQFMEQYPTFTLCTFPESFKNDLKILGTKSGRDTDKLGLTSLTPVQAETVAAPSFAEADMVIECRILFKNDIVPEGFVDSALEQNYPQKDYHLMYYGEILGVQVAEV